MEELDATEDAIFERTASLIGRSTDADAIHALSQLSKPTLLHRTPSDCISLLHRVRCAASTRVPLQPLAHAAVDPRRPLQLRSPLRRCATPRTVLVSSVARAYRPTISPRGRGGSSRHRERRHALAVFALTDRRRAICGEIATAEDGARRVVEPELEAPRRRVEATAVAGGGARARIEAATSVCGVRRRRSATARGRAIARTPADGHV